MRFWLFLQVKNDNILLRFSQKNIRAKKYRNENHTTPCKRFSWIPLVKLYIFFKASQWTTCWFMHRLKIFGHILYTTSYFKMSCKKSLFTQYTMYFLLCMSIRGCLHIRFVITCKIDRPTAKLNFLEPNVTLKKSNC